MVVSSSPIKAKKAAIARTRRARPWTPSLPRKAKRILFFVRQALQPVQPINCLPKSGARLHCITGKDDSATLPASQAAS